MKNNPLPRLDEGDSEIRKRLLPHCRLKPGEVWEDPNGKHRVACLDAGDSRQLATLMHSGRARLAVQDPPYNLVAFERKTIQEYIDWCKKWVSNTLAYLSDDSAFYIWLGADQNDGFQPLPDFMLMMRSIPGLLPRSFITSSPRSRPSVTSSGSVVSAVKPRIL